MADTKTCPTCVGWGSVGGERAGSKVYQGDVCPKCLGAGVMVYDEAGLGFAPSLYEAEGHK